MQPTRATLWTKSHTISITLTLFPGQNDRQAISGFWIGARRSRGSHPGTCMFDQWKWVDAYGRTLSIVSGFSAFMSGRPDEYVCLFVSSRYMISCMYKIVM